MPWINYSVEVKDRKSEGDSGFRRGLSRFSPPPPSPTVGATGNPSISATVTAFKVQLVWNQLSSLPLPPWKWRTKSCSRHELACTEMSIPRRADVNSTKSLLSRGRNRVSRFYSVFAAPCREKKKQKKNRATVLLLDRRSLDRNKRTRLLACESIARAEFKFQGEFFNSLNKQNFFNWFSLPFSSLSWKLVSAGSSVFVHRIPWKRSIRSTVSDTFRRVNGYAQSVLFYYFAPLKNEFCCFCSRVRCSVKIRYSLDNAALRCRYSGKCKVYLQNCYRVSHAFLSTRETCSFSSFLEIWLVSLSFWKKFHFITKIKSQL